MSFSFRNISCPTPDTIRKASNAVLAGCAFVAGSSALCGHDTLALVWAHVGGLAKMISIFYADKTDES